jgi:hypothetical protein
MIATTAYQLVGTWSIIGSNMKETEGPSTVKSVFLRNHPEPFTGSTEIDYGLADDGIVHLRVYDVHGRLVSEPVQGFMSAGSHRATFSGEGLPGGVYFYHLETQSGVLTGRMTLLK